MQFPITIGLHRSRFLDAFIVFSSLVASAAALAFPRSMPIQAAIICSTCLFAVWAIWRLTPAISTIRLEQSGEISLQRIAQNEFIAAKILPGATVHPWLTVMRIDCEGTAQQTLIVTVDSLRAEDFRRLRVFLRWRADFSESNDGA